MPAAIDSRHYHCRDTIAIVQPQAPPYPEARAANPDAPYMQPAYLQFSCKPVLAAAALLALLTGCATHSAPDAAGVRDTATVEREGAPLPAYRGPGQIQVELGSGEKTEAEILAERKRQSTTAGLIPSARTYLGTVPCEAGQCQVQRMNLTLLPDGRWRSVSTPIAPAGRDRIMTGCWRPEPGSQPLIHLYAGQGLTAGTPTATLRMQSPAVLRIQNLGATHIANPFTLTIQAEVDFIRALETDTRLQCPAS